jgi:hypothetical protein
MISTEESMKIWQAVSGSVAPADSLCKADLEKYLPKVLERKGFVRKGQGRKAIKEIWDCRGDPLAIVCSVAACIEIKICTMPYLKTCLTNFQVCDKVEKLEVNLQPAAGVQQVQSIPVPAPAVKKIRTRKKPTEPEVPVKDVDWT